MLAIQIIKDVHKHVSTSRYNSEMLKQSLVNCAISVQWNIIQTSITFNKEEKSGDMEKYSWHIFMGKIKCDSYLLNLH